MTARRRSLTAENTPAPAARPSRDEVRERLLDAARTVFLEVGYVDARLEDVARVAGFTKGAVYSNFGSKLDLFAALLTARTRELTDRAAQLAAGEGVAAQLAAQIVADPRWNLLVTEFGVQAQRRPELRETWVTIRRAQRGALAAALGPHLGRLHPGAEAGPAALLVLSVVGGLSLEHAADPDGVDRERVAAALALLLPEER